MCGIVAVVRRPTAGVPPELAPLLFDLDAVGARLAKHMRVSPPAVTEALRRMSGAGYLRLGAGKEISLTRRGKALAEVMARRHRLLERRLADGPDHSCN